MCGTVLQLQGPFFFTALCFGGAFKDSSILHNRLLTAGEQCTDELYCQKVCLKRLNTETSVKIVSCFFVFCIKRFMFSSWLLSPKCQSILEHISTFSEEFLLPYCKTLWQFKAHLKSLKLYSHTVKIMAIERIPGRKSISNICLKWHGRCTWFFINVKSSQVNFIYS